MTYAWATTHFHRSFFGTGTTQEQQHIERTHFVRAHGFRMNTYGRNGAVCNHGDVTFLEWIVLLYEYENKELQRWCVCWCRGFSTMVVS